MGHVIVGTAGHIDHGKSTLVRALTGTDPDRLPEEKRRKITIDLGFAFLDDVAAIIDVPGHEKFIHNMVAGAATIDFALLVVAADDGIMPQTREHLHILQLLGIRRGAIVLTKCAIADPNWRELVKDQIRATVQDTFLHSAPLLEVDSLAGDGIDELRAYLLSELPRIPSRDRKRVLRIPLDRVFSIHGHGTVVTGTVVSGTVEKEARVVLLPGNNSGRVKQLQSNARDHAVLEAGMRAALNLVVDSNPIRGQTVCRADTLLTSRRVVLKCELIPGVPPLKDRQRVRILIGTEEVMGRYRVLSRAEGIDIALLLLDREIVAAFGDHFILRRYSPVDTLGGGVILDVDPSLRGVRNRAQLLEAYDNLARSVDERRALAMWIKQRAPYGIELSQVAKFFALPANLISDFLPNEEWITQGGCIAHIGHLEMWQDLVMKHITSLHREQPVAYGFTVQQISTRIVPLKHPLLDATLASLVRSHRLAENSGTYRIAGISQAVDTKTAALMEKVSRVLSDSGFMPPSAGVLAEQFKLPRTDVEKALVLALKSGRAVRLGTDLFFDVSVFERAIVTVRQMLATNGSLQVAELSKTLGSSRKYVVPFLEHLDSLGITERRDNIRVTGRNLNANS